MPKKQSTRRTAAKTGQRTSPSKATPQPRPNQPPRRLDPAETREVKAALREFMPRTQRELEIATEIERWEGGEISPLKLAFAAFSIIDRRGRSLERRLKPETGLDLPRSPTQWLDLARKAGMDDAEAIKTTTDRDAWIQDASGWRLEERPKIAHVVQEEEILRRVLRSPHLLLSADKRLELATRHDAKPTLDQTATAVDVTAAPAAGDVWNEFRSATWFKPGKDKHRLPGVGRDIHQFLLKHPERSSWEKSGDMRRGRKRQGRHHQWEFRLSFVARLLADDEPELRRAIDRKLKDERPPASRRAD